MGGERGSQGDAKGEVIYVPFASPAEMTAEIVRRSLVIRGRKCKHSIDLFGFVLYSRANRKRAVVIVGRNKDEGFILVDRMGKFVKADWQMLLDEYVFADNGRLGKKIKIKNR